MSFTVTEHAEVTYHQERRGRPGTSTRYPRSEKPRFFVAAAVRSDNVAYDAVTDGMFPSSPTIAR